MNKTYLSLSIAILCSASFAQTGTVVPLKSSTTEASSYTAYPFGLSGPARLQYLYDSSLVGPAVVAIKQIAFRGNGGLTKPGKKAVDLEIVVSTTKTDPWAASGTFASNHGSNKTIVFKRKKIDLPAQPAKTPNDFITIFKLDKSFVYIKSQGNLVIEYIVHGQPAGSYAHDTSYTSSAAHTNIGLACGGVTMTTSGGQKLNATSTLGYNLTGAPAKGVAIHILGSLALSKPVALPWGGCKLYQDLLFMIALPTSASGTATIQYPLPTYARDMEIYGQFLAFDSSLTKLATSQSIKTKVGGLDPHTRIYSTSSATVTTGSVQRGVGIVTQLK